MILKKIYRIIASCFYIGNIKGGGTIVSLLFCLIAYFMRFDDTQMFLIFSIVLLLSSVAVEYADSFKGDDSKIVADELIGMIVSLLFLPRSAFIFVSAFIFFRYMDIAKPLFIRKSEDIKGTAGIIMDDIISGIAANALLRIVIWIL